MSRTEIRKGTTESGNGLYLYRMLGNDEKKGNIVLNLTEYLSLVELQSICSYVCGQSCLI